MIGFRTRSAQREIAILRDSLMGGRGPAASETEVLANTRYVLRLGGQPTSQAREHVARQTSLARAGGTFDPFGRVGPVVNRVFRAAAVGTAAVVVLRSALRALVPSRHAR